MRICLYNLTSGFKSGGLETFTWGLAEALAAAGHEVEIVAGEGARKSPTSQIRLVQFPYVPRERFPNLGTRFRKLCERLSFARNAFSYVKGRGFDVILINKPYDFFVLFALKRAGFRGVTGYNSGGIEFFSGDRWLSKAVDLWLPCSEYNAVRVSSHYGCQYEVLSNGVDTDRFTSEGARIDLVQRLFLPQGSRVVMSVGRLIGTKGNHVILDAIRNLANVHFVIIGVGPERDRLAKIAEEPDLLGRVHFLGEIPHAELPQYLRAADVFVQPSIGEEAFGISIAEAMACGLPVLASNGWGLREVVTDGVSGVLVSPGAVPAWRTALQHMLTHSVVSTAMGVAARKRIVEHFTWAAAAKTFVRAIEQRRSRCAAGRTGSNADRYHSD